MKKRILKILKKNKLFKKFNKKRIQKKKIEKSKKLSETTQINPKMIIFSVFSGRLYACSPKAIYEYMIQHEEFNDYQFIWAFNNPDKKRNLFKDPRTTVVKFNSNQFYEYLAEAKYWVFNFKTPKWFIKNENQVFVQCWHGTPLKKIGMDIKVDGNAATKIQDIHTSYIDDAKKYDYFISPSKYATDKFISSFGLDKLHKENIILEKGYPRNDSLFNKSEEQIEQIKEDLGIDKNKTVLLYCPTFRDDQFKSGLGHTYELGLNLLRLKEKLGNDYVLLLRLHYLVSNNINISQFKGFAIDVSKYDDVNDLYLVSDALITDYSSVFFDYANLNRPILFYMYDLDQYQHNLRDFYIDLKELPGPILENEKDLITSIKNVNQISKDYKQKYEDFCQKYTYLDDGNATERIVKEFIKL